MKKYLFCLKTIVFINKGRVKIVSFFTEVILDLQGKNFEKYFLETNDFLLKIFGDHQESDDTRKISRDVNLF
jgi:hypothetical protein